MKKPVKVVVTGAAGQIGYSLLFRIGAGDMLGTDQPIDLMMLERNNEQSLKNSRGVQMELDDCAFPLLNSITATSDPYVCFKDAEIALLVGSRLAQPTCREPTFWPPMRKSSLNRVRQ